MSYSYIFELPYLFFTLIRSSTSIMYTLVAFIMSAVFKSAANRSLSRREFLQVGLITLGVCLFQIDSMQSRDRSSDLTIIPLLFCLLGLLIEAVGAYLLQSFREEASPSSTDMYIVNSFWGLVVCAIQCRLL